MAFVPVSPRVAWAYRVTLSTPLCHAASHQCLTVSPYHPMLPCLTPCRLGLSHHPVHTVVPHLTSLFCHLVPSHPISLSCPVSPRVARACDIADPTLCHRVSVLSRRLKVSLMS